jgi:hypothetical protein
VFKKYGLRIEGKHFFGKEYVRNLFGSTQFSGDYQSWTKKRDHLQKMNK